MVTGLLKSKIKKITVKTDVTVHQAQGTGSLSITPTAILAAMTVSEVNGTIKPDMDVKPTEVELTNLPDFLQDEEVKTGHHQSCFSHLRLIIL